MSQAIVRIPAPLRGFTGGASEVPVDGATVGAALEELGRRHEGLLERIVDGQGQPRSFVNLYLGDENIRTLEGLESRLGDGAVIHIVPAVAGGGR